MIGIGPKSLSAIERGTVGISLAALKRVCSALSVSSDSIIFGRTEENDVQFIEGMKQLRSMIAGE